ncbi:HutD family protein [Gemmatimonas sp. UBA7669]|uniref:HutD/Ves family protein n=1 Tax=Gemmatimonas sp. UBA7669 TaxID=1946568 RepID=UPI0025BEC3A1|nr:HutD family protein [Gemmatimonas sp. UBA7669]
MTPASAPSRSLLHVVSRENVEPTPWRNGGGTTQELLVWPQPEGWQLRVSVARIDRDGPFSEFPGVRRWFTVLDGAGVALTWPTRTRRLLRGDEGVTFDGADAPDCQLLRGPTTDLNVMWDARLPVHGVQRVVPGMAWTASAQWRGVYVDAACSLQVGSEMDAEVLALPRGTLVWRDGARNDAWCIRSAEPLRAWWMWASPVAP